MDDLIAQHLREARVAEDEGTTKQALDAACRVARDGGSARSRVAALRALALWHSEHGAHAEVVHLYQEAVDVCRAEGDDLLLSHTLRHQGDVHRRAGELGEADAACREALSVYRGSSRLRPGDLANALRSSALVHEALGRNGDAHRDWAEARDIYARLDIADGVAEATQAIERLGTA